MVNYGSMSPLSFNAQNVGWVAQDEVFFLIPLEKWKKVDGKLVFQEWTCVSPFIFVNDPVSMTTGREVYGWAKVLGEITQDTPEWLKDPTAPLRLFGLNAPVFPKEYQGGREENRLLLEIHRNPPSSFTTVPPNLGNPLVNVSDAAYAWLGLLGTALDMATATPLRGYRTQRSPGSFLKKATVAGGGMLRLFRNPFQRYLASKTLDSRLGYARMAESFTNQITLKQFRDAGKPNEACYQSLVSSRMGLDRLNRFGFLGDYNLLFGDPSGGFTLRLHQYAAYPIVDALGLEVQSIENGQDAPVAILKPMFPVWSDVDLYYDVGETLCSRYHDERIGGCSSWKTGGDGQPDADHPQEDGTAHDHPPHEGTDHENHSIPFNTVRGGSTQAIAGPFNFPDLTVQVYPLLASRDKLQAFIDHYLNDTLNEHQPSGLTFEPFGHYVYLFVESLGTREGSMWSESNNIGLWADKSVSFCVPVKFLKDGKLQSVALVSPYRFANDNRAVISDREINGRIAVMSTIKSQPDVWLEESGPIKPRRFLELSTEVFPALNVGTQSVDRVLVRIDEDPLDDRYKEDRWRFIAERWRAPLLDELERKTVYKADHTRLIGQAKALALEILAMKAPINWLNLKQYRDAADTARACYQALVNVTRTIERVYDIREIETPLFVRITELPEFPIVSTLGLKPMDVVSTEKGVEQVLQPIRPFWMRLSVKENLGKTLCWRVEEGPWNLTRAVKEWRSAGSLRVGEGVLGRLGPVRQRLQEKTTQWLAEELAKEAKQIQRKLLTLAGTQRDTLKDALHQALRDAQKGASPANGAALIVAAEAVELSGKPEAERLLRHLFRSISTNDLYEVVESINIPLAGLGEKAPSGRFSLEEAQALLHRLDDVQLLVEPILSDEWEHWGEPRSKRLWVRRKPDFCIQRNTFPKEEGFGGKLLPDDYNHTESEKIFDWLKVLKEPEVRKALKRLGKGLPDIEQALEVLDGLDLDAENEEELNKAINEKWDDLRVLTTFQDIIPSAGWFKRFEENWVYHLPVDGPIPAAQKIPADHDTPADKR